MDVHRRFVQISMQLALDIYAISAYNYDIKNNYNALRVLMIALAIDAIKCNQAYAASQF